jgi:hypothetical protein
MLWGSLVVSAIFLLIANILAFRKRLGEAAGVGVFGLVAGFLCAGPAIALTGLLTSLGGLVLWFLGAKPRSFLICSLVAMLASHVAAGLFFTGTLEHQRELRKLYPTQSLASRLEYETLRRRDSAQNNSLLEEILNPAFSNRLNELESQLDRHTIRTLVLERLHENVVEDFIDSPGFGIARRIRPRKEYIDLPESAPIPFPTPAYDPATGKTDSDPLEKYGHDAAGGLNMPPQDKLWGLHRDSVVDFVNAKGFGYVKDREHVRGFQPHQFHSMPDLPETSQRWLIQKIELVSLLTHEEPVVYISDHLPRMDELRRAATRPLTSFEKQALEAQRSGTDLEVASSENRIQMMGSIRAVNQCLNCHEAKRGELMGAFSYYLKRESTPGPDRRGDK